MVLGKWWLREVWLTEVVTKGTSEKRNHQFREENPQGQARGRTRGTGLAKKEGVSAAWHGSCETKIKKYSYFDIRILFFYRIKFRKCTIPLKLHPCSSICLQVSSQIFQGASGHGLMIGFVPFFMSRVKIFNHLSHYIICAGTWLPTTWNVEDQSSSEGLAFPRTFLCFLNVHNS